MDIKNIFAHFDKKVTDFKIWVNKVIFEQNNKLKTFQDYLVNTLDSHKKLITDFTEENSGGGGATEKEFTKIHSDTLLETNIIELSEQPKEIIVKVEGYNGDIEVWALNQGNSIPVNDYCLIVKFTFSGDITIIEELHLDAEGLEETRKLMITKKSTSKDYKIEVNAFNVAEFESGTLEVYAR